MDRRQLLIAAIAASVCGYACGAPPGAQPLSPGQRAVTAAVGIRHATTPARGRLAYDVAWSRGSDQLISVELGLSFELVQRTMSPPGRKASPTRVRLGDPTYDVSDVTVESKSHAAWVASVDGTVRRVDLGTGTITTRWPIGDPVTAVAVSPDDALLVLGTSTGVVCLRRTGDAALLQCVAAHGARVSATRFDASGKHLASASWDGSVTVWRVPSLTVVATLPVGGSANDVAFSPDGTHVAIARSHAPPRRTPEVAARERRTTHTRATGSLVTLWRPGKPPRHCQGHVGPVTGVAWTADGKQVVSVSWDRSVRLWSAPECTEIARVGGFGGPLWRVQAAPSGRYVAVAGWAGGLGDRATAVLELLYPSATKRLH